MPDLNGAGALLAASVICAVLGGCGVKAQDEPIPVDVGPPSPATTAPLPDGDKSVTVYFVRDGRLVPVKRPAADTSTATAIALLLSGPNGMEANTGAQTALVPQQLTAKTAPGRGLTLTATRDFTSISGDNQLLASAQLVWTVTEADPAVPVQVIVDGKPVELPTDRGLARRPVDREDYRSVAPLTGGSGGASITAQPSSPSASPR